MKFNVKHILEGITNTIFVREEVEKIAAERMAICKMCPKNSKNVPGTMRPDEHCTLCGCNLHFKTRSLDSDCPSGQWNALASEEDSQRIWDALKDKTDEGE